MASTGLNKNVNYAYTRGAALAGVGTNLIGTNANTTSNVISSLSYRGFGGFKGLNYGSNPRKLTLGYNDQRQQMTSMVVQLTSGSDTIISQTYDYHNGGNNNGRIQKITDGVDSAYTTTYGYDDYNRLTSATATAYTRGYSYDEWGNLKTVTATGGGQAGYTINYATNTSGAPATNRISNVNGTISYAYDAAGNLTQEGSTTYSYDAASRLKEVGTGGNNTYGYDGDGHRVRKVESGAGAVYYVRSTVLGQVAFETKQTLGAYRAYVYAPNGRLIAQQSTDSQFYWVHKDHLGSGRKLTNSLGTLKYRGEFDPHGQALLEWSDVSTDLNSRKFTGYERDAATGLDYAQARMYNSGRGRFMQADPARINAASLARPQSLNLYSYVQNDPVSYVDLGGTCLNYWNRVSESYGYWDTVLCNGNDVSGHQVLDIPVVVGEVYVPPDYKQQLIDALDALPQGCKDFFGGEDTLNMRKEEIRSGRFSDMKFIDMRTQGGQRIDNDPWNRTYQQYWDQERRDAYARALSIRGPETDETILLGTRFFGPGADFWAADAYWNLGFGSLTKFQQITLVHEYMHILNNMNEGELYAKWTAGSDGARINQDNINRFGLGPAISIWMAQGCPRK